MPTALDRVQCLLQPDLYAKVLTLSKHNRRSASAMCAELIEDALKLPKWKQQIDEALIQVPAREDPREAIPQRQLKGERVRVRDLGWTDSERDQVMEMTKELIEEGQGGQLVSMEQRIPLIRLANAGTITMEQAKEAMVIPKEEAPVDEEKESLKDQVEQQGAMLSKMQALLEKLTGDN